MKIEGGNLVNRIFGDAGDDIIWTGDSNTLGDVSRSNPDGSANSVSPSINGDGNFASGGTGDDTMIGTDLIDFMFGGPGHDVIQAHKGANIIYGNEGDDFLSAKANCDECHNEIWGGAGNDYIVIRN